MTTQEQTRGATQRNGPVLYVEEGLGSEHVSRGEWLEILMSGCGSPRPFLPLPHRMEASARSNVPTSSGKPSQKTGGCYSSKVGTNSTLMPMILE